MSKYHELNKNILGALSTYKKQTTIHGTITDNLQNAMVLNYELETENADNTNKIEKLSETRQSEIKISRKLDELFKALLKEIENQSLEQEETLLVLKDFSYLMSYGSLDSLEKAYERILRVHFNL